MPSGLSRKDWLSKAPPFHFGADVCRVKRRFKQFDWWTLPALAFAMAVSAGEQSQAIAGR